MNTPNLSQYFAYDFGESANLKMEATWNANYQGPGLDGNLQQFSVPIKLCIRFNLRSSTKLLTCYIPPTKYPGGVILSVLKDLTMVESKFAHKFDDNYFSDTMFGEIHHVFSKKIYLYSETSLSSQEITFLEKELKGKDLRIAIRSQDYVNKRNQMIKLVAFISHDSKDKESVARPLASGLYHRQCFVWYDEYSLKPGMKLRESIENGIREAGKCIVILSKAYLENDGWAKNEFESIFTKERLEKGRVIIPVWCGVTEKDVYNYSTSLPNTFAYIWPDATNPNKDSEIEKIISALHLQLNPSAVF